MCATHDEYITHFNLFCFPFPSLFLPLPPFLDPLPVFKISTSLIPIIGRSFAIGISYTLGF